MHGFKRRLSIAVALACGVTALTGSAFAGSQNPSPGQEKKAEQAPAKAKPAKGINSTTEGKKPSNATNSSKPTKTTVGANPDVSKRYGNGKTAAQIAKSRGAPGSTEIRGPGNGQPHKVCRNGHWVDVHAVKSYPDNTCSSTSTSSATAPAVNPMTGSALPMPTSPVASSSSVPAAGSSTPSGGVLGAQHTEGAGATGGVAGAFKTLGGVAAGTLPFTGFPLWAVVLIGLAAIVIGWMVWRRSRGTVTTDAV